MKVATWTVIGASILVPFPRANSSEEADLIALQGVWELIGAKSGNVEERIPKGHRVEIVGNSFVEYNVRDKENFVILARLKLHPSRSPKTFDWHIIESPVEAIRGKTLKRIYEINVDLFRYGGIDSGELPAALDSPGVTIYTFRRVKNMK